MGSTLKLPKKFSCFIVNFKSLDLKMNLKFTMKQLICFGEFRVGPKVQDAGKVVC